MEDSSLIALILAIILSIERIFKNFKYIKSSCCEAVTVEETQVKKDVTVDIPKDV